MPRRRPRRLFAVWLRLRDGQPWECQRELTLTDTLTLARQLRGPLPLFPGRQVWIAPPAQIGLKPSRAQYRRAARTTPQPDETAA